MYTILTTSGERVAIFGAHVASVEMKDNHTECVVVMSNGKQYITAMQGELIVNAIIDILNSALR